MRKSEGTGVSQITPTAFHNTGMVEALTGTLRIGSPAIDQGNASGFDQRGVARVDDRRVLNGIFWRLRTGARRGRIFLSATDHTRPA